MNEHVTTLPKEVCIPYHELVMKMLDGIDNQIKRLERERETLVITYNTIVKEATKC